MKEEILCRVKLVCDNGHSSFFKGAKLYKIGQARAQASRLVNNEARCRKRYKHSLFGARLYKVEVVPYVLCELGDNDTVKLGGKNKKLTYTVEEVSVESSDV